MTIRPANAESRAIAVPESPRAALRTATPQPADNTSAAANRLLIEKIVITVLIAATCWPLFFIVERFSAHLAEGAKGYVEPATFIDAYIPFVPVFIWAYALYYPWVFLPVFAARERDQFRRTAIAYVILEATATIAFIVFPTHMHRPIVLGDGYSEQFVRWFYRMDNGFNLIPSLHVAHSVLVGFLFAAYRPRWMPFVGTGVALITVSTVLVKQHYFVDVPVGIFFAFAAYQASAVVNNAITRHSRARA